MASGSLLTMPAPSPLNAFERARLDRIAENRRRLGELIQASFGAPMQGQQCSPQQQQRQPRLLDPHQRARCVVCAADQSLRGVRHHGDCQGAGKDPQARHQQAPRVAAPQGEKEARLVGRRSPGRRSAGGTQPPLTCLPAAAALLACQLPHSTDASYVQARRPKTRNQPVRRSGRLTGETAEFAAGIDGDLVFERTTYSDYEASPGLDDLLAGARVWAAQNRSTVTS